MTWIDTIDEEAAQGELADVYQKLISTRGKASNIMRAQSLNPEAMDAHLDLYLAVMFDDSGLSREERELIAVAVSAANDCSYCITHHANALSAYWGDDEKVARFAANPALFDGLDDRQRLLADYALQLTAQPSALTEAVVEELRAAGLDDDEILCANLVVGYFNFVNRIALGLGVGTSSDEADGYNY